MLTGLGGPVGQAVAQHDLENLQPDGSGKRVVHMRRAEEEFAIVRGGGDRVPGHDRRKRHARTECLREGQYVGNDAIPFEGEHCAGATQSGLGLVQNQQHSPGFAVRLQRGEIPHR